jgi:hypothetical protein
MIPMSLFAAEMRNNIQVERIENNEIQLTAKCENIENKIASILELNKLSPISTPITEMGQGLCSANITKIIPKRIVDLPDTTTAHPGPNCWNTSLFTQKVVQSRRFTSENEMTYWMNSPLCRELVINEVERPGDIIAIRVNNADAFLEMHGFIYLTDDFSFSKSGFDPQFPYELTSSEYVYQVFALGDYGSFRPNPECRRVVGKPDSDKCPVYANVFRCKTYENFLNSENFNSKEIYKTFDKKLLRFETKLSIIVLNEKNYSKEKSHELKNELNLLNDEYLSLSDSHSQDYRLWENMKFRIISFRVQINLLDSE